MRENDRKDRRKSAGKSRGSQKRRWKAYLAETGIDTFKVVVRFLPVQISGRGFFSIGC
jgi:hypothetical protein